MALSSPTPAVTPNRICERSPRATSDPRRIAAFARPITAWRHPRRLDHTTFPYVYLDAAYPHVRTEHALSHQRCRVLFIRNVLAHVPRGEAEMVAGVFRTIFAHPDLASMSTQWDTVQGDLAARYPQVGVLMDTAKTEVLAFAAFPREHWRKICWTEPTPTGQHEKSPGCGR